MTMVTRLKNCTLDASLAIMATGCASTRPMPVELAEARRDYEYALAGEAAEAAPAELHTAKQTLAKANEAFALDPESARARDYAYVAQRQAAIARAQARIHIAEKKGAEAKVAITEHASAKLSDTEAELQKTKAELAESQAAMAHLKELKAGKVTNDARGTVITLSGNVLFETGKSVLRAGVRDQLGELADTLIKAKAESLTIEGYTDATGTKKRNAQLSQARAEAVAGFFASRGIKAEKMHAVGRGSENPLASNDSVEGRATNRRVEVVLQGKAPSNQP